MITTGYLAAVDALKALGIDEVLVYCVNDGAGTLVFVVVVKLSTK